MLDQLLEAHLLLEPTPGRYRFHDLTRAHAAGTATGDQAAPAPEAALGRLLDYYRHTAAVAMDAAYPYEREHRPPVPPAPTPGPELSGPAAALAWLDTELPNLLAAARYAAEHGRPAQVLHLSAILHRHLRTRGRYHDADTLHQQALDTARDAGDQAGQLDALVGLGDSHLRQGRYEQAADHHQQALQIARTTGHRPGELTALNGLGHIDRNLGRYEQVADHYQRLLDLAQEAVTATGSSRHGRAWAGSATPPATRIPPSPTTNRRSRSPTSCANPSTRPAPTTGSPTPTMFSTGTSKPANTGNTR